MAVIESPKLLTTEQAAEYLGVGARALVVWRWNRRYNLPYVRVGRLIRYRPADLERFLESRTVITNNIEE